MNINSKKEILATLNNTNRRVTDWFSSLPAEEFFTRQAEVWSASDNLDHLIKAVKPIAKAMKLPRLALQGLFGKAETPSKSYDEICKIYREEIVKGAQASGSFLPKQENPGDKSEEQKQQLLDIWKKSSADLISAIEGWNEEELDQYRLPHPILGNLTMREMLFFTIYHSVRHASLEGD